MNEAGERARIVRIAREYIGTPYHSGGRKKGIGIDCLTLLAEVYTEAGLIASPKIPNYAGDFFKHKGTELYLNGLLQYTHEVTDAKPGDIALWRYGRCYSHGAIVVEWPHIIHAHVGRRCMLESVDAAVWLKYIGENTPGRGALRPMKIFSFWGTDVGVIGRRKEE